MSATTVAFDVLGGLVLGRGRGTAAGREHVVQGRVNAERHAGMAVQRAFH